jgi:hypothetical protein
MMDAATVMQVGMMAVVAFFAVVFVVAMYEPKPVPYMDGHY